jgi:hypothetical protein
VKSLVLTLIVFGSVAAQAGEPTYKIEIKKDTGTAEVSGFTDALYGRGSKTCFSGSANQVCSKLKSQIGRVNTDLSQAGATQRFNIETCAQNPERTMVIYKTQKTRKTVFINRCGAETEAQQIALSLSN